MNTTSKINQENFLRDVGTHPMLDNVRVVKMNMLRRHVHVIGMFEKNTVSMECLRYQFRGETGNDLVAALATDQKFITLMKNAPRKYSVILGIYPQFEEGLNYSTVMLAMTGDFEVHHPQYTSKDKG